MRCWSSGGARFFSRPARDRAGSGSAQTQYQRAGRGALSRGRARRDAGFSISISASVSVLCSAPCSCRTAPRNSAGVGDSRCRSWAWCLGSLSFWPRASGSARVVARSRTGGAARASRRRVHRHRRTDCAAVVHGPAGAASDPDGNGRIVDHRGDRGRVLCIPDRVRGFEFGRAPPRVRDGSPVCGLRRLLRGIRAGRGLAEPVCRSL